MYKTKPTRISRKTNKIINKPIGSINRYNKTAIIKSYNKNRFKEQLYFINGNNQKSFYKSRKSTNNYNNVQKHYRTLNITENRNRFNYLIFINRKQIIHLK